MQTRNTIGWPCFDQHCSPRKMFWNLLLASAIAGCGTRDMTSQTSRSESGEQLSRVPDSTASEASGSEHGHKAGTHGGIMVSLGADSYHVEAVVEQNGTLRLYTLGNDESRVIDVEAQTLKGFARGTEDPEAIPFTMDPQPQDGDPAGRTSLFSGSLPPELVGRPLDVTIPTIVISGERFRIGFTTAGEADHKSDMPAKVADAAERELYLTPGGRYSEADILANGSTTASIRFAGIKSSHDMSPKPGDRICPVTETKANPKFTWIIGGREYQFCCPPCVDEFVKLAKTNPEQLRPPEEYTKQLSQSGN